LDGTELLEATKNDGSPREAAIRLRAKEFELKAEAGNEQER